MRLGVLLILVSLLMVSCGGTGGDGETVATIGDIKITSADLDKRRAEMPPRVQPQFEGPEGARKLLEGMLDEEAFFLAAKEMKLDENPEVKQQLKSAYRRILIQSYYGREVMPHTQMNEEDLRLYYDENIELFTKPVSSEVRQVVVDSRKTAERVRKILVDKTAGWDHVVNRYCTDELTKQRKGKIGSVQVNAALIPLVGSSAEMSVIIDTLSIGGISPIVQTGKGYHIFTVLRRDPETVMPFEKMEDVILRNHGAQFAAEVREEKVGLLREKFNAQIFALHDEVEEEEEELAEDRTAAKLFALAQSSNSPMKRIKYYKEIVTNHSDDPFACEAQFMIGFVYSEELHDYDQARGAFEKVLGLRDTCKKDLVESATWMLENMGTAPPDFQEK